MLHMFPGPSADMLPQMITELPPNVFVGLMVRSPHAQLPLPRQHHERPAALTRCTLVSSVNMTRLQSVTVQWRGRFRPLQSSAHMRLCQEGFAKHSSRSQALST